MIYVVEIIPSINSTTFAGVKEKIAKVEPFVKWCHLDVTDGIFSKHLTWHDPRDLINFETKLNLEVHLMINKPEKNLDQWLIKPIKRIIVHLEAISDIDLIIKKCRESNIEIGLAINPETFWGRLKPWLDKIDMILVLAVHPGPSGQKMGEEGVDKIKHLRKECQKCIIEIDGGVNLETAKVVRQAGANLLVAGSYLFNSGNISKAIEELRG